MVGWEDIFVINGVKIFLFGDIMTYYLEIYGIDGLGLIKFLKIFLLNIKFFCIFFDFFEKYKGELIIVDVGRLIILVIVFILEKLMMKYVKEYYIMGGVFLMFGNVILVVEVNFYGDFIVL